MLDLEGICRDLLVYFIDGCIGLFVASGFHDTWRRWKSHGESTLAGKAEQFYIFRRMRILVRRLC